MNAVEKKLINFFTFLILIDKAEEQLRGVKNLPLI
jgi:hypothetical protein